jgi:hypothetical protein
MQSFIELTPAEALEIQGGDALLGAQIAVAVVVWGVTTYYSAKAAYEYFF